VVCHPQGSLLGLEAALRVVRVRLPRGRRELLAESCSRYLGRTTRASPGIIWRVSDVVQSADGIPIAFESAGTGGRALVFIHGWSCDRAYWKAQVPAFADRHRVVALDLAGHGESGGGRAAYTMAAFGADVAAVMDHLGLEDAVLIGHSMGGDAILETALLRTDQVRGLVWVDTYATLGTPRTPEEVQEFTDSFRPDFVARIDRLVRRFFPETSDPELIEWIMADMSSASPEIALDVFPRAIGNHGRVLELLPQLRVPLVSINPDYWPVDADALLRHGVADVLVMSGVGHFLMMEDPDRFNLLLDEALRRLDSASA
jgi:pimeloyl-ACP methyl ester carboxylesterase